MWLKVIASWFSGSEFKLTEEDLSINVEDFVGGVVDSEILSAIGLAVGSRIGGDFFTNIIDNPFDLYKYYTRNLKRATAERELENFETSLLLIQIQQQKGKNER